jgi:hypothetical protein
MNTDIQESACKHFKFLESHYEFSRTEISRSHVRFENNLVFFDITADARDGICVDFGRFDAPGVLPQDKSERLSLNTFLGALQTHRGTFQRATVEDFTAKDFSDLELQQLAKGLEQFGHGLILGDSDLYELVRQLRFWHVGHWVNSWGTTIIMSPDEIQRQRQLLPSIENLISKK